MDNLTPAGATTPSPGPKNRPPLGAHSRRLASGKLDGRTRVARRLRAITAELTDHLGGPDRVTAPQRYLIERVAIDIVRLEALDAEMATGRISEHDARIAHALRNSVRLALREIGFAPPPPRQPTFEEIMAEGDTA
jgi:hypothetical protein